MRHRKLLVVFMLFVSTTVAAELAEKWRKRISGVNVVYTAAVTKADNARFFAIQKANSERLSILKKTLSDATKAGDFDAAALLNEKVRLAELDGISRPKPKNIVRFGRNEYALIEDKVSWHTAKKRCEEMGGHLVTFETPDEQAFIRVWQKLLADLNCVGA
jgi:hypothetical protein